MTVSSLPLLNLAILGAFLTMALWQLKSVSHLQRVRAQKNTRPYKG